jgi:transposase
MQYALIQVLPDVPPGGVCAGFDWASTDHVACVVDMAGRVADRFTAAHDKAGIAALIARLRRAGACEVAIERGDGPLVAALPAAGLTVVVITSRQVRNLRSRFSAAGDKNDRFDSYVLADTLRTRPGAAAAAGPGRAGDGRAAGCGACPQGPGHAPGCDG